VAHAQTATQTTDQPGRAGDRDGHPTGPAAREHRPPTTHRSDGSIVADTFVAGLAADAGRAANAGRAADAGLGPGAVTAARANVPVATNATAASCVGAPVSFAVDHARARRG